MTTQLQTTCFKTQYANAKNTYGSLLYKKSAIDGFFYKKRSTVRLKKYSCRYCQDSIRANFSGYPLPKGLQAARPNPEVMIAFFFLFIHYPN